MRYRTRPLIQDKRLCGRLLKQENFGSTVGGNTTGTLMFAVASAAAPNQPSETSYSSTAGKSFILKLIFFQLLNSSALTLSLWKRSLSPINGNLFACSMNISLVYRQVKMIKELVETMSHPDPPLNLTPLLSLLTTKTKSMMLAETPLEMPQIIHLPNLARTALTTAVNVLIMRITATLLTIGCSLKLRNVLLNSTRPTMTLTNLFWRMLLG